MVRISAIFIAICMVLIAASVGAALYLGLGMDERAAAIVGVAVLAGMILYNTVSNRVRDRLALGDQIADLSRGTADLARQVMEISHRLDAIEPRVDKGLERARNASEPLSREIGELGILVRQIAETVASHAAILQEQGGSPAATATAESPTAKTQASSSAVPASDGALNLSESAAVGGRRLQGMSRNQIADLIAHAIDAGRIDLYLQPIVTLPQRKVRSYEALSRLRIEDGEIVPAVDFIEIADSVGLTPKIDTLLAFRCVQVLRRLQLKSRDVGLFCNISSATLNDASSFRRLLDFMDANRALASSLTFEFSQSDYRGFGPLEKEGLAALAERGFRFSLDHVSDLRVEPKDLADQWFRYMKVPARLLLDRTVSAKTDIHPEDLADLLARSGIDLIAERIESEGMVLDLLDYDVRFGQGFLFSPPRPVRAEALQSDAGGVVMPASSAPSPFAAVATASAS
jgi:cyclic-di-GMP phosphodiesterase TipF (flagellum assembly factor)